MNKQHMRFYVSENPHRVTETSHHPAKCTMCFAVSRQGLIIPIFVEGTITNQQYLKQLQNEVIPVIQGEGHVDTFSQQDGACPHKVNVLNVQQDVFGTHVLSHSFPECFWCR